MDLISIYLVYLGVLLHEKKQTAEAQDFIDRGITICRDILEKTPKQYEQLYTLALAFIDKRNVTESLGTYKKAIVTCPAKGVLKKELMTLDLLTGQYRNAQSLTRFRSF
ncbi:MAG: hypothetical protein HQK88_04275 [Nitrospirae bacterium]|nr:hypothetical protein [Nitrospirota bacterium]MBF0533456.1 hypothetical protein [Nitrospirota bacterium]MBF0616020.1 hypothetical protein [Nitrospirota bacterium]